jgi:hypothetical protein
MATIISMPVHQAGRIMETSGNGMMGKEPGHNGRSLMADINSLRTVLNE